MHALKPSSLFRPSSRPSSPAPLAARTDAAVSVDRAPRNSHKLSLTSFRRPSPAPAPAPAAAIVQDGSYLEVLSFRLNEAVAKVLAQPTGPAAANEQVNGKRPIPPGRGRALGALISTELNAARDVHLRKAVLRALHRPLSTLLSTVSAQLLVLLSSPAFLSPAVPTPQAPHPNPTQMHALGYATLAGELLDTFDDLRLGIDTDSRADGLKPIRDGLNALINRVINPLAAGIVDDLMRLIAALEIAPALNGPPSNSASKVSLTSKAGTSQHPSIAALQTVMPVYASALSLYFATSASQATLATHLIALVWSGLVALSNRFPLPPTPPSSPAPLPAVTKKGRGTTPPTTPPSSRFMLKLPPSRPPSPHAERAPPSVITDTRMFYDLLRTLPRPGAEKERLRFAREAVDDAFTQLKSLISLLELVHTCGPDVDPKDLEEVTADISTLIALPVLFNAYVFPSHGSSARTVASMLGLSEERYKAECLAKPARAEEYTISVGKRLLDILGQETGVPLSPAAGAVVNWLTMEVESAEADAEDDAVV